MRIIVDMQGAQMESRLRGIGRYTSSLTKAMIRNRNDHEIFLLLNGQYPTTIDDIYEEYKEILPKENIKIWNGPAPVEEVFIETTWRRKTSELMREAFIISLKPDFVLISTLFEGFSNNVVTSVGLLKDCIKHSIKTGCMFYDAIPLMNPEEYLPNKVSKSWYEAKMHHAQQADTLLAISESSRNEAIEYFKVEPSKVFNISTASESDFSPIKVSDEVQKKIKTKFCLSKEFLMYSGATDERKNHLRLIKAYSMMPGSLRGNHHLVFVGRVPEQHRLGFIDQAKKCGLNPGELIITGGVTDEEMITFYNMCKAFIFPSWHEGFGLPALEAMMCGKAVIASNTSSLPEVIGSPEALFDPFDEGSMCLKMVRVLRDERFRMNLERQGLLKSKEFSWDKTASLAISAIETTVSADSITDDANDSDSSEKTSLIENLIKKIAEIPDYHDKTDLLTTSHFIDENHK